jgi:hypothetical protein
MRVIRRFLAWVRQPAIDVDALLRAIPRAERIKCCAALVPRVTEADLRRTVRTFFEWTFDLPASEAHHDAGPFGLFDHSLEVAARAARTAYEEELGVELRVAAWSFALFHDVGKIAMIRVHGPESARWNPYVESLLAFYARHGRGRCGFEWIPGRGRNGMNWPTPMLIGRILPVAISSAIGPTTMTDFLERRTREAERVAALVGEADRGAVGAAMARRAPSKGR